MPKLITCSLLISLATVAHADCKGHRKAHVVYSSFLNLLPDCETKIFLRMAKRYAREMTVVI